MINNNIIEEAITNVDDRFIYETIEHMDKKVSPIIRITKKIAKMAACFVIVGVISFSSLFVATAAGNIRAYSLLYSLYPSIAKELVPVNETCEDNGIKMSVEAINVHDDSADIYISIQDMTGDRIDETIDLFDSYDIGTNADQIGGCTLVSYDKENKIATFLITVQQMSGKDIKGGMMNFSVKKFLSGKKDTNEELSQISNIIETSNVIDLGDIDIRGTSNVESSDLEIISLLNTDSNQTFSPVDGVKITAYGYVDGKLHVQAYYENILEYDNHGSVYLKNGEETVNPNCGFAFWDRNGEGSYEEYIFDVGPDEIDKYKIYGQFSTCASLTKGNWNVSFPIENR